MAADELWNLLQAGQECSIRTLGVPYEDGGFMLYPSRFTAIVELHCNVRRYSGQSRAL
jgi:hypothetical protein